MRVGVDVGGTTVKVGFIDNYEIVDRLVVETKKETLFSDVCREVKEYANKKNYKIDGLGFGLPGHIVGTYIRIALKAVKRVYLCFCSISPLQTIFHIL